MAPLLFVVYVKNTPEKSGPSGERVGECCFLSEQRITVYRGFRIGTGRDKEAMCAELGACMSIRD